MRASKADPRTVQREVNRSTGDELGCEVGWLAADPVEEVLVDCPEPVDDRELLLII